MEAKIGRKLIKGESVHHIDGVRNNNHPANLELWSKSHPSGQRVSDLLDTAPDDLFHEAALRRGYAPI